MKLSDFQWGALVGGFWVGAVVYALFMLALWDHNRKPKPVCAVCDYSWRSGVRQ